MAQAKRYGMILLLLTSPLISPSTAEIKTSKISSDSRPMILFEKFSFTMYGRVSVSVSGVNVVSSSSSTAADPSLLGFFLLTEESALQIVLESRQNPYYCVLDSQYILLLFNFRDLSPAPHSSFNRSYPVTTPHEYSLYFANCVPDARVSMDVSTELYNESIEYNNDLC